MTTSLTTLLTAAALALPSIATAAPLPEPVQQLEWMVGTWKATGTVTMGPDSFKVAATWSCKRVSAKLGVLCSMKVTGVPGVASYEETHLFGYEPNSKTYHWFAVTMTGETHDHVAQLPTGNTLQWTYTGTQDGKPLKETISMELSGAKKNALALRSETTIGGVSTVVLEMKARR